MLQLLEALDDIINKYLEVLWYFSIEKPDIPDDLKENYANLTDQSIAATESLVFCLKSELRRKEKALAETAALLVLSKKSRAIWGEPEED